MASILDPVVGLVLPKYCGPDDLLELLRHYRADYVQSLENDLPVISLENERSLLQLSYAVSMMKEEGRSIKCQLHIPSRSTTEEYRNWSTRFNSPIRLYNADVLRKLSSAAMFLRQAFIIEEIDGNLFITGILKVRRERELAMFGPAHEIQFAHISGSTIAIDGPGHLFLYGSHPSLELRGGKIFSNFVYVAEYPRITTKFRAIAIDLLGSESDVPHWLTAMPSNIPYKAQYICEIWQRVIRGAVGHGSGGAFAICTPGSLKDVAIKYPIAIKFSKQMQELWLNSFDPKSAFDREQLSVWHDARTRVNATAEMLGQFSNVDGCVIFDDHLNSLGFGAKLIAPYEAPASIKCTYVDAETNLQDSGLLERVGRLGTRHLSAFNLCAHHPGVAVFVVSQDGDIRIFYNDASELMLIDCSSKQTIAKQVSDT